jgi:hypothetical protein
MVLYTLDMFHPSHQPNSLLQTLHMLSGSGKAISTWQEIDDALAISEPTTCQVAYEFNKSKHC